MKKLTEDNIRLIREINSSKETIFNIDWNSI